MKTEKQKIIQRLLLLRILAQDENIWGNLKLQKQVFLNELALIKSNFGGLYYKYFRYQLGPFSADLAADFQWVANTGLAHKTTYKVTDRGQYLVDFVDGTIGDYKNNSQILKLIDKTTARYTPYDGQKLMKLVYQLALPPEDTPGTEVKIEKMPTFMDILSPERHTFKCEFQIPPSTLEDIKDELGYNEDQERKLKKKLPTLLAQSGKRLRESLSS